MSRKSLAPGALALALFAATPSWAASDADLAEIRDEIRQLKENYEARIQALEARLKDAEAAAAKPSQPTPHAGCPPAPASSSSSGIAAFNPAISAVLQGRYANLSQDPEQVRDQRLRRRAATSVRASAAFRSANPSSRSRPTSTTSSPATSSSR